MKRQARQPDVETVNTTEREITVVHVLHYYEPCVCLRNVLFKHLHKISAVQLYHCAFLYQAT